MTRILPLCILLLGAAALRADYTEGSFSYTVIDGKATVTGFFGTVPADLTIPSELDGYPVTAVGDNAFLLSETLVSVTLPGGLDRIGTQAFYECGNLTSVTFLGDVGDISVMAFYRCVNLTSVTFLGDADTIGSRAFYGSTRLETLSFSGEVRQIGEQAFVGGAFRSVTLPKGLEWIDDEAFSGCGSLTTVVFPESLRSVGERVFDGCDALRYLFFDGEPPTVGADAFPSGVARVTYSERYAAAWEAAAAEAPWNAMPLREQPLDYEIENGCAVITGPRYDVDLGRELIIPAVLDGYPVTAVGEWAFFSKIALQTVMLPEGLTSIGNLAFSGCDALPELTLPKSLRSIGSDAFSGCDKLETVTFREGLESIGEDAFANCPKLKAADFPATLRTLGVRAFSGCTALAPVMLPAGVAEVGAEAFAGCTSMSAVFFLGGPPAQTDPTAFPEGLCGYYWSSHRDAWEAALGTEVVWNGLDMRRLCFRYEIQGGEVTVTARETEYDPDILIPPTVGPYPVTKIGSNAFQNAWSLRSVTLPAGMDYLAAAFYGCTGVTLFFDGPPPRVTISDIVETFPEGRGLKGYYLPAHRAAWEAVADTDPWSAIAPAPLPVTYTLGEGRATITGFTAEAAGSELLVIPPMLEGCPVAAVGEAAFSGRAALKRLFLPAGLRSIGKRAFESAGLVAADLPEGMTEIGERAFASCTALTSVLLLEGLKTLGSEAFSECDSLPSAVLPSGLKTVGAGAFFGCDRLSSVYFPVGLESIGEEAFARCAALEEAELQSGLKTIGASAFSNCVSLASVTFPSGLTSIGESAFVSCTALGKAVLPSGLTELGKGAFLYCASLQSVTLPPSLKTVGESAFASSRALSSVTFSEGLTAIGALAFSGCGSLASVDLPDSLSAIGDSAFNSCTGLRSVVLPAGLNTLGYGVFAHCSSLTSVDLPAGLAAIGAAAFSYCSSLPSVTLPAGLTSVGSYAFDACTALTRIYFDGAPPTTVGTSAFPSGCTGIYGMDYADAWEPFIGPDGTWYGLVMKQLGFAYAVEGNRATVTGISGFIEAACVIPDRLGGYPVTAIGNEAFATAQCQWTLTSVVIPDTVTVIGERAFQGCVLLESVTLPAALEEIGASAFYGCRSLTAVTLPETLTAIQDYAFFACPGLTSLTVPAGVAWIGNAAFSGGSSLTSVTFRGLPPQEAGTVYTYPPFQAQKNIPGTYPAMLADAWGEVLDEDGRWGGLKMSPDASGPTLAAAGSEKLPGETALWLLNCLTERGVTSGAVALAEGTTAETLAAARTLGVVPTLSRPAAGALQTLSGETLTVAAQAALEIAALDVSEEGAVTLTLRVRALAGQLSAPYAPAGLFTLAGGPGPLPGASDPDGTPLWGDLLSGPLDWKRLDDTTAEAAVTLDTAGAARFFRARAQ